MNAAMDSADTFDALWTDCVLPVAQREKTDAKLICEDYNLESHSNLSSHEHFCKVYCIIKNYPPLWICYPEFPFACLTSSLNSVPYFFNHSVDEKLESDISSLFLVNPLTVKLGFDISHCLSC